MTDKDVAIRYCQLIGEDPFDKVQAILPMSLDPVTCTRWEAYVPEITRMRAMMQAIGESLLSKLDQLIGK